ncbi:MAG TPA: hypothetical protein VE152_11730 [Acidimicrobiales bacterium]|jgi:hypothetical protein|nr:hypothetical protein [Acidimicrobiales bacterium]
MRMMLQLQIDNEAGNRAIDDGTLPKVLDEALARLQPEAAYFTTVDGSRGGYVVFDLRDTSEIPFLVEPLFTRLNAKITCTPVMDRDDLQRGLSQL